VKRGVVCSYFVLSLIDGDIFNISRKGNGEGIHEEVGWEGAVDINAQLW
jgi:hypothetical protein